MRRIDSPLPGHPAAWIGLPDVWKGYHAKRRDQAVEKAADNGSDTLTSFAVAMALLEDWQLPGLSGNPEKWDFEQIDLTVIAWVIASVLPDFGMCFIVPKALPSLQAAQAGAINPLGDLAKLE